MRPDGIDAWPTGRLLSAAARLVEQSWESVLRAHDLTHAGLFVLHAVADGPASQREIARTARVTDQTMSRTIEKLERAGHVTREPDPRDERRKLVTATDSGLRTYRRLIELEREDTTLTAAVGDVTALRAQLLALVRALRT
ncbi:MarR family winged helix-turn-helix transcriptional regulator [Rhodococcus sp. NPDC003318]|uniref:MarR family winged helix-turn-helix transcriptional regulator n=1 Tax=Rhodococcus sp. NPDC003318 TaxID=3364503 RepID=UPI003686F966